MAEPTTNNTEELIPVKVEPTYLDINLPVEYICVYHKLLIMLADYGEQMLKDCKASCVARNTKVVECYHMFLAAVSAKKLGKNKEADTLIKYIKNQINILYNGKDNCTQFKFPIDDKGEIQAIVKCGDIPEVYINPEDKAAYDAYMGLISEDIIEGKTRLATAIQAKSVHAYNTNTLIELAEKITEIPQNVYSHKSDFEDCVVTSPYMWNIYTVARNLGEETLPDYFPVYMNEYRQGYGGYWVAETRCELETQYFEGADAYYTSDKHFYVLNTNTNKLTHTYPDGTVEVTSGVTEVTHTWTDDKLNRFIVHFYLQNGYSVSIVNGANLQPQRVAITGNCGGFSIASVNTIADVWVLGEITDNLSVNPTYGDYWNSNVCIRGYKNHTTGTLIYNRHIWCLYLPDLESCSARLFSEDTSAHQDNGASLIILPKLKTLITEPLLIVASNDSENGVKIIHLPSLVTCNVPLCTSKSYQYQRCFNALNKIILNSLTVLNITSTGNADSNSKGIINYISSYSDGTYNSLQRIGLPSLKRITAGCIIYNKQATTSQHYNMANNLIDIEVGEMETNLNLTHWYPATVLADINKTKQLLENIKNHIALKVSNRTGLTALNVTFGFTSTLNAHSDTEVSDAWTEINQIFNNKNWTVS